MSREISSLIPVFGGNRMNARLVGEQLAGVPIGRGDDRLAATKGVGERAGRSLRHVLIRRDVEIGDSKKNL
jgi:hypothetical protein